jgi:Zn-dependent metalloprotease
MKVFFALVVLSIIKVALSIEFETRNLPTYNFAATTGILKNHEQNIVLDPNNGRKAEGFANGVSRLNRQQELPPIEKAKILDLVAKERNNSLNLEFYRSSSDLISDTVEKDGYYRDTSYKVFGSKASITFIGSREVFIDALLEVTEDIDLYPSITEDDAIYVASCKDEDTENYPEDESVVELLILPSCFSNERGFIPIDKYDGRGKLAYQVERPNNNVYFIDAHNGEVLFNFNNDQKAFASTYYNGNVSINTLPADSLYWLEDLNRTSTAVNCNYSPGNCTNITKFSNTDNLWIAYDKLIASQVQWGAGQVLDYFKTVHGRNGLDGEGGPSSILSENGATYLLANKVHYGGDPNTASWTGTDFIYGDGDGVTYGPMVALDIVAHEMAHAIMEYEANLVYYGESGALTESFGDITAAAVSYWIWGENNGTWLFGEDVYTPGIPGDAIRYLNNPHLAANKNFTADDDPDHTSQMYNGTLDNGGVHVNSGIPNKAFYFLVKGGNSTHGGPYMTGIGIDAAYAILYRAVTVYYTSTTQFYDARLAMLYACEDLYGEGFYFEEIQTAWGLVGVGSVPVPNPTDEVVNGGFEGTQSPWTLSGTGVGWVRSGTQKKAGSGYLQLGLSNSCSGNAYQGPIAFPANSVQINLTFWVWITSSDSLTVIHDRMWVEIRNSTNASIINQLAILTNMDATSGYVQKSYNLELYTGLGGFQLSFRSTNDGANPTTFRIDEVYLDVIYY